MVHIKTNLKNNKINKLSSACFRSINQCVNKPHITKIPLVIAPYTFFLFKLIFIGVQLLYNVLLVSAVQQSESAIPKHVTPPFWISFPFRSPQCIKQSCLCYTHYVLINYLFYTQYQQCVNPSLLLPPTTHISLFVSIYLFSSPVSLFLLCK